MLNERENESLVGKHDGHSRAVSHTQKPELTPALWQLVGCKPRAFPTVLIHSRVPKSLFCCQVRKHLLSLSFMFNGVGRAADYPGGNRDGRDACLCVVPNPLSLKGGHLSSGLFEAIRRLLLWNFVVTGTLAQRSASEIRFPLRALRRCVVLDKSLVLSEPLFSHLWN